MKNKIRILLQSIILGLIAYVAIRPVFDPNYIADFESYCPLGGISSLGSKLNQGTMSCNMSETQVLMGIGLIIGILLVGKLFCSYVCPIGTVSEWLGKIGDKLHVRINIPKKIDRPLRGLKYLLLFATLYFTMTSSELFCKEFDPYFSSANLFNNNDIVLYFAIPAFVITILGAVFFKLFWCKYLCPLSALSNIFLNVVGAGAVIILFILANVLGAGLSYIWLIGGLVLVGAVNELGFMKSFFSPLPKITRNVENCTDCNFCDTKCPQNIKISEMVKVDHIDCNLCTDCVFSCPRKNTLTVNKRKGFKYLSPVAVVLLIALSLGAASQVEFTTIAEKWGHPNDIQKLAVYEQSGLKNVKCYGSSMSLKNTLTRVDGIYGLDTYAKSHTVKIYYDPSTISEGKVKESLFTPVKQEIRRFKPGAIDSLAVWEAGVYGLFDIIDFNNLFYSLREDEGVFGFETNFGEPVLTTVYYDPSKTNSLKIKDQIEKEEVIAKKAKAEETLELNFKVEDKGENKPTISVVEYKKRIFRTYDRVFNNYKKYTEENLSIFIFPMPEAASPQLRRYFGYLTSHLSVDDGIVRLSTRYTNKPSCFIYFDPSQTNVDKIKQALIKKKLTIFLSNSETKDVVNPFHIKPEGVVKKALEVAID